MADARFFAPLSAMVLAVALCAVSCVVERPVESKRTVSSLSGYVDGRMVPLLLCEPAVVVSVASDVDRYLALTDEEKENFDMESVFPGGIRHIDDRDINVRGVASVYPDGNRLGDPGAKWTVRRAYSESDENSSAYYSYYSGSDYYAVAWEIECIGDGVWTLTVKETDSRDSEMRSEISVALSSETDSYRDYHLEASGTRSEDEYHADSRTVDGPVTVRCMFGSLGNENTGTTWSVRPVNGRFNTDFYRGQEHLDYCNYTYTPGEGRICETGLAD